MKCRFPLVWNEIGEGELPGPKIIQGAAEKVALTREDWKPQLSDRKAMRIRNAEI